LVSLKKENTMMKVFLKNRNNFILKEENLKKIGLIFDANFLGYEKNH